jgi:hypothetical protein
MVSPPGPGEGTRPFAHRPASARKSAPPSIECSTQSSPDLHDEQGPEPESARASPGSVAASLSGAPPDADEPEVPPVPAPDDPPVEARAPPLAVLPEEPPALTEPPVDLPPEPFVPPTSGPFEPSMLPPSDVRGVEVLLQAPTSRNDQNRFSIRGVVTRSPFSDHSSSIRARQLQLNPVELIEKVSSGDQTRSSCQPDSALARSGAESGDSQLKWEPLYLEQLGRVRRSQAAARSARITSRFEP